MDSQAVSQSDSCKRDMGSGSRGGGQNKKIRLPMFISHRTFFVWVDRSAVHLSFVVSMLRKI